MGQKYVVQLLTDKEFDSLPYSRVKESIGCADPERGLAFVRQTGIPAIDMTTLTHEVNHLLEKHNGENADLDGIYYKSGSNFFNQIFGGGGLGGILGDVAGVALAPFTGGASLGLLPLLSAAGGAIQNAATGGNILGGALKGFGVGGVGSGLGGAAAGGLGLLGNTTAGLSGAVSGLETGANTFISGIPGFGAGGALNAATGLGGASFGSAAAPVSSSLGATAFSPGQAGIDAAAASNPAGVTLSAVPQSGGNLLGSTTAAFNAATPLPAAATSPVEGLVQPSSGFGGTTGVSAFNPNAPAMSLTNGEVGNVSGQPINLLGAPPQAGLPSTTVNPTSGLASTIAQSTPQANTGITTVGSNVAPSATTTASAAANNPLSLLTKNPLGTGAAILGASSLLQSPTLQTPTDQTALQAAIQKEMAGGAATPLGQSAQNALQQIVQSPPSSLDPALAANDPYFASTFATIDQNFKNAKAQLDASYNSVGQLGSGEYQDQLRQLTQNTADQKNQIVAQENQSRYLAGQQEQFQAIQQSLGVDNQTMQDLAGLTGLSVQEAATQYGASVADIQALRTSLGTVGGNLVSKGLGVNSSPTTTVNLLGVNTPATATA